MAIRRGGTERLANQTDDLVVIGEALLNRAIALVAEEDFPLANRLNERPSLSPNAPVTCATAWAHNNLGSALLVAGDRESARQQIERAIAIFAELDSEKPDADQPRMGPPPAGDPAAATATFAKAMRLAAAGASPDRDRVRRPRVSAQRHRALVASGTAPPPSTPSPTVSSKPSAKRGPNPSGRTAKSDLNRLHDHMGHDFELAHYAGATLTRDQFMQLVLEASND